MALLPQLRKKLFLPCPIRHLSSFEEQVRTLVCLDYGFVSQGFAVSAAAAAAAAVEAVAPDYDYLLMAQAARALQAASFQVETDLAATA